MTEVVKSEQIKSETVPEGPVSCDLCGQQFSRHKSLLQHHTMIHEENRYKCKKCFSKFVSKAYLSMHELAVHGGKKHRDRTRDGTRKFKEYVRTHQKSMTNEQKFQCDECDAEFTQRSSITQHKLSIH